MMLVLLAIAGVFLGYSLAASNKTTPRARIAFGITGAYLVLFGVTFLNPGIPQYVGFEVVFASMIIVITGSWKSQRWFVGATLLSALILVHILSHPSIALVR